MIMELFPFDNLIVGILVIIVGFVFHFIGQLISIVNWEFAQKLGLQEKNALKEHKVYEHAIAAADVAIGWIYGIVGIGLILDVSWAYYIALIPGTVFIYHSIFYWVMQGNHKKSGMPLVNNLTRIVWFLLNFITGILVILIAL